MTNNQVCTKCGAKMASDVTPEGLCPRCLLQLGLEAQGNEFDEGAWLQALEPPNNKAEIPGFIGLYRILEVLGEGGMGLVYLAEQREPIRRRVALKVIKLGMDTKQVIARFESERQALALMNHPHIAKVLDAGSTEQGRPYFVMEYVAGMAITEYCDKHRLSTRERLTMFKQVCEAIQHAHQKGIIHRDIKPSNVLVETEDDKPIPKVIDFGVAKATHQQLTEKTLFTQHGMLVGTPAYMSPEQVAMNVLDIDTRTDVYSLGVLLYELLVGTPPFEAKTLRKAGFDEMRRIIREENPPSLSSKLTNMGETASHVAAQRQTKVKVLESQLRGDLEWITIKALEKEPKRRYQSAAELADDVSRNLINEPILARPPSTSYRISKFVRKNRIAVGVLAAFIVLLMVALGVTTILYLRAEVEARRVKLETAEIEAVLLDDVNAYLNLSGEALELHRRVLGESPDLARYLVRKFTLLRLVSLESPDAKIQSMIENLAKESSKIIHEALIRGDRGVLETAALAGKGLEDWNEEEAEKLYREMLKLLRQDSSQKSLLTNTTESLAGILKRRGAEALSDARPDDAVRCYREALDLRLELRPERSIDIANSEMDLGRLLTSLKRYEEAEKLLLQSYDYLLGITGLDSGQVQMALRALIALYKAWRKEDEAIRYQKLLSRPEIASTTDLGPLPSDEVISQRNGFSARSHDRLLWVFGPTRGKDAFRSSTCAWSKDINAADGLVGFQEILDESGYPAQLLPFTEEEMFFNRVNKAQWELRAGPVVMSPDGNQALLFYSKMRSPFKGAVAGESLIGVSLAIWENPPNGQPIRPEMRENEKEPTILFPSPEPAVGMAGAFYDGGYIYAYATNCAQLSCRGIVAKAPFDQALERGSWRFYDGSGWSSDWNDSAVIMDSAAGNVLSVHWNNYLQKYVAFYQTYYQSPLGNTISMRTADRPEGPWSAGCEVFAAVPPIGSRDSGGGVISHPALTQNDGRIEYITYVRNTGFFKAEIRLVQLAFR